jgi:phosphatidylglycerol lysyltransferase
MKRRWLLWILVIVFVWVVFSHFAELKTLATTLAQGKWQWVALALLLQIGYYILYTALYQAAFATVEVRSRVWQLLPVVLGALFINVVAPTGGTAGNVLFLDDATRRGESPARTAAGVLLALAADFVMFALVLLVGLLFLLINHDLQTYEIVGAVILFVLIAALGSVLLLGLWRPTLLRTLFGWLQRAVNGLAARLKRSPFLAKDWAESTAAEFTDASTAIAAHPNRLLGTLGIGLLEQICDVASLYALCLAFYGPVSLGVVVATYGIGVLFWIVAITPGGIGVVEGVMPLVFISLDVPGAAASVITLAFRGLSFWLPVFLGFLLLRQIKTFGGRARAVSQAWGVHILALLTGLMGIVNVVSAVTPSLMNRVAILEQVLPLEVHHGGHLTAALAGFALFLLAANLWRRKRAAWWLTLGVLAISLISHLVKGLDYEEATLAGALMIALVIERHEFHARSDVPSIRHGLRVLAGAVLFTLAYGVVGFYLLDRHFSVNFGLSAALRQTLVMFTQFYNPGLEPLTGFGRYFAGSIYTVGALTVGYALLMLMRPVFVRQTATAEERARAKVIVEAYGRSSLARYALFDDKAYYFSPGGSVVPFVAKGRAAVTLGDPIGPAEDVAETIRGFMDFCQRNDWVPAFYQTLPDNIDVYKAAGLSVLAIGEEAVVDLTTFSLEGKTNKHLRNTINTLSKKGHRTEYIAPPLPAELLHELRAVSDEWLTLMHGSEKRFSLGWFDDDYIGNGPVMVVYTPEGIISAFANILPEYQRNESTIDLMRHRTEIEDETMEFLFLALFQWAKAQGYAGFNLGLSALSGVGEQSDDPTAERVLHYIYEHINQFYNFAGLHTFKEKFHPRWEPRYLVYPGPASLLPVALALVRADSGDNFVQTYVKDWIEQRRLRHRVNPERKEQHE